MKRKSAFEIWQQSKRENWSKNKLEKVFKKNGIIVQKPNIKK